jgi:hypothetical protein
VESTARDAGLLAGGRGRRWGGGGGARTGSLSDFWAEQSGGEGENEEEEVLGALASWRRGTLGLLRSSTTPSRDGSGAGAR